MEIIKHDLRVIMSLTAIILVSTVSTTPISAQVATSCTSSLISSFTPCFNYITGSTNGGGSPTADCCKALAGIITSSTDCACLIMTGNVPFGLPINRTLAISLPRVCRSTSVPLQCRDTATPLPGPGSTVGFGPALPPLPPMPPQSSTPPLTTSPPSEPASSPPSSSAEPAAQSPTTGDQGLNQGQRPLVLPSSATKHSRYYLGLTTLILVVFRMVFF